MTKGQLIRAFGFLTVCAMLLNVGTVSIPVLAAEETPAEITVKMFQSTSHYDMGIDPTNVRLGWSITSTRRAMYQAAYHIVITDEDGKTAWDSGWVESDAQVGILVPDLKPETIYTARVQVRDRQGTESPMSEGLVFETAPAALEGQWLSSSRLLRKTFTLDQPLANVERARCYMTGSGIIETRLNGKKVGDLVWNPKKAVSDVVTYYNTFDITDMLLDGKNAVGAYTGLEGNNGFSLNGMLRIHYKDGSVQTVSTGEGWKTSSYSEITRTHVGSGEDIDARLLTGWDLPDFFENGDWTAATVKVHPQAVNGELTIPQNSGIYKTNQSFSGDYTVELTVTVQSRNAGFLFGVTAGETNPCLWQIGNGGLRLHHPGWKTIDTPAVASLKLGQKTTMKLEVAGNTVTTFIDGVEVAETTLPDGETTGALGIRAAGNEVATYDRLAVIQNGEIIWEDNFDTADTERWTYPGIPTPKPAISGTTVIDEYNPQSVTEMTADGKTSYILDFGQNM